MFSTAAPLLLNAVSEVRSVESLAITQNFLHPLTIVIVIESRHFRFVRFYNNHYNLLFLYYYHIISNGIKLKRKLNYN